MSLEKKKNYCGNAASPKHVSLSRTDEGKGFWTSQFFPDALEMLT